MTLILVVEDDREVASIWQNWLQSWGYDCDLAHTYRSAIDKILASVRSQPEESKEYDLIILDHNLDGGLTGLDVLIDLAECHGLQDYGLYRVVVATASTEMAIVPEYARLGAVSHLVKDINEHQLHAAVINALSQRERYTNYRYDWETAIELLQELNLLPAIDEMQREIERLRFIEEAYEQLRRDLQEIDRTKIIDRYEQATELVRRSFVQIDSILPFLKPFSVTRNFLDDVREVFRKRRLIFHALQSYLCRIAGNPNAYMVKHLEGRATGHYEYRVGRDYRLYFRRENGQIVLERFDDKKNQGKVLEYIEKTGGGSIFTGDRQAYLLS
ncbi:MAG: response regulator [Gloeomargarita sp. SKYBB_i_bin120]|nr:response regulator [Gloeomargarita sp. SKYB120]MDW8177685.1 response regulator [Gloeomargarita sp. SKYBB_i_bin120]